jgi:hypothetical protein
LKPLTGRLRELKIDEGFRRLIFMVMIGIDSLIPGMVLAGNVLDRNGRLLLAAGIELEAKHLMIFRTWGVGEADIAGLEDPAAQRPIEELTGEALEQVRQLLLPRYRHADLNHPVIAELLRLAVLRRVKNAHP